MSENNLTEQIVQLPPFKRTCFERNEPSKYYADKSLFIKSICENKSKNILITAPQYFGKTFNLSLLRMFLEIKLCKNGKIRERDKSYNYKIFTCHNLLIAQDLGFLTKHFAKYPVIQIHFEEFKRRSFQKMLDEFGTDLIYKFLKHKYLIKSDKLDFEELRNFYRIAKKRNAMSFNEDEIMEDFQFLVKCLYKHYNGTKVFLLIDNYDSMFHQTGSDTISRVYDLMNKFFSIALNCEYLEKVVVTGIHYYDVFGSFEIEKYLFLQNHEFVRYYGITEKELASFLSVIRIHITKLLEFKKKFRPYYTLNGLKLYSLGSVLDLLGYNEIDSTIYEDMSIQDAIDIPIFRFTLEKLCFENCLTIKVFDKLEKDHMITLQKLRKHFLQKPEILPQFRSPDLYLSYCLQRGHLTYVKTIDGHLSKIKLANKSTIEELEGCLISYYCSKYKRPKNNTLTYDDEDEDDNTYKNLENCVMFFNTIHPTSGRRTYRIILSEINQFINKIENFNKNFFHDFIFDIMCKTDFLIGPELSCTDEKPNLIFYKQSFGLIIHIEYDKSPESSLEIIINKYANILEAKPFHKDLRDTIYLGINVKDKHVSNISVLVNSKDLSKAMYI